AHKTIEAQRLRKEGVPVVEIAEALELSEATVRRYLKTTAPSQE
ncbi:helix-turn-helix domain-containing protein, partial [Streptomyces sp. IBSBF 2953]|nr:helix-turn-helix domain-containing protein [Streptomyces hayashii]